MIFTYTPEGAEERRWDFEPSKLMSVEAEAIERQTGWTYHEFGTKLGKGSIIAKRALLWVLLKRENPPLLYSQVDVPAGSMAIVFEREEIQTTLDGLRSGAGQFTAEERAEAIEQVELALADMPESPAPKVLSLAEDLSA